MIKLSSFSLQIAKLLQVYKALSKWIGESFVRESISES
ncbi:hypothetical protein HFN_1594 [Helicobacter fennelliae MRY12-0050]|uniref:Uncharacterized protein n=1 Tax=Helicobacter fennelliae MRY12-0050 TaxID=1325130 RepID=T1D4V9_9HELI|nr:hypothetical protein HFN_1594 [Helicobacter fennelliae MRY12-0050]